jgi:hypothetical protein
MPISSYFGQQHLARVHYPFWGLVLLIADTYRSLWGIFLGGAILVAAHRAISHTNGAP